MSPVNKNLKKRKKRAAPEGLRVTTKTKSGGRQLKVTMVKGWAGKRGDQLKVLRGLGLRRRMDSNVLPDNQAVLGMIARVAHLVSVEPAE